VIKRSSYRCFLAGCITLFAHFTVAPSQVEANQVLTFHEEDNGRVVDLHVNTEVRVELSGTPTTGYWWYFQDLDQEFLELVWEETRDMDPPGIQGGKALGIWLLRTRKSGPTSLKLIYHRPWEHGIKALRSFCVELRIVE
jgi:predicted secreted protein